MNTQSRSKNKYEINMISGPLMPKLVRFFVPLMLSGILQLLFNAVDLIVVGKWAGNNALAAVGSTTSLINVFSNLLIGISLGANVVVARFIAQEDEENTSKTVHTAISIGLVMGLVSMILGLIFSKSCLALMGSPAEIINDSALYLKIYFCGMPFFAVFNYGAAILRASGDTRRPLYFLIFAGVLNAGLNMILVIIFHLDVVGVAVATIFSQMVSCLLVVRCLLRSKESYRLVIRKLRIDFHNAKQILAIGVPAGLQSMIINFSNVLLQSSVNSFGPIAMAGYTAANNIFGFMYMTANSISQACMSFTSQNYAVGKMKRVRRVLLDCMILECVVLAIMGTSAYFGGHTLLSIYTDSMEVIESGMQVLVYTTLTYFLCGIMDCLPGALRGMGFSTAPMILSVIGTVGTRIVWIFVLFPHYRSLNFLFISYPASWIFTILMQSVCLIICYRVIHKRNKGYN